jgi:hypothetical protein
VKRVDPEKCGKLLKFPDSCEVVEIFVRLEIQLQMSDFVKDLNIFQCLPSDF